MLTDPQQDAVQRARAALLASPVVALRDLDVAAVGERLILSGKVNCFYHKQLAQEVVRSVLDGVRVTNVVSVVDSRRRQDDAYVSDSFIG